MKFIDFIKRSGRRVEKRSSYTDQILNPTFDSISTDTAKQKYGNSKAMTLSAVWRAVECISSTVAGMEINIKKKDADNHLNDVKHSANFLLNERPNVNMTRYDLISNLIRSMLLFGNGFAYIDRNYSDGTVKGIYYIQPGFVTINYNENDWKSPVKYSITGIGEVEPDNLIHIRNYSRNGVNGISTIQMARETLEGIYNVEQNVNETLANGLLRGCITNQKPLTSQQKMQQWASLKNFANASGGILVLENGQSYSHIGMNLADYQYIEERKFSEIQVAQFFGVPLSKMLTGDATSYNSEEEQDREFMSTTISPILQKLQLEFGKIFLPSERKKGYCVKFDKQAFLRGNLTTTAQYLATLQSHGIISINEARNQLEMSHLDGGDGHFMQINMGLVSNEGVLPATTNENNSNQFVSNNVDETE